METRIAEIATVIGEPVRAKILWALLDGRAYTATELSLLADASPQNTSIHLSKLVRSGFLEVASQGRHRYYRFANDNVAYAIEALANLIPEDCARPELTNVKTGVKYCRTCYDHLAGQIGVQINEALIEKNIIGEAANTYVVTDNGIKWFVTIGIDTAMCNS